MSLTSPVSRLDVRVRRRARWPRWLAGSAAAVGVVALGVVLVLGRLGFSPAEAWRTARGTHPLELLRYAEVRLIGHPQLEAVLLPAIHLVRSRFEREPPAVLADLGKGQRANGLSPAAYDRAGVPVAGSPLGTPLPAAMPDRLLTSLDDIVSALATAGPGSVLEIAPGNYTVDRTLVTGHAGLPGRPITLRAGRPGTVLLSSSIEQGVIVSQPYWVFENLDWRGVCPAEDTCEHAYHVVGGALGTVIRNNRIEDFNAQIKVNGEGDQWPDDGMLQFNTLLNTHPRQTAHPVTPVDLVGANGWQLLDNRVEDFIKAGGNGVSFGMFLKGASAHGRIERNLVVCTKSAIAQPGLRVGISLGGGGTAQDFCRDGKCENEHSDGVIANNVVAHCNDAGIDVFHSRRTLVAQNTLVNTLGILVRESSSDADVVGNLMDGMIRERRGGHARETDNRVEGQLADVLVDPDALELRWRELPAMLPRLAAVPRDFCASPRPIANTPGATLAPSCAPVPATGASANRF